MDIRIGVKAVDENGNPVIVPDTRIFLPENAKYAVEYWLAVGGDEPFCVMPLFHHGSGYHTICTHDGESIERLAVG